MCGVGGICLTLPSLTGVMFLLHTLVLCSHRCWWLLLEHVFFRIKSIMFSLRWNFMFRSAVADRICLWLRSERMFSFCKVCDMLYRMEYMSLCICRNENSHNGFRSKQATSGQATCLTKWLTSPKQLKGTPMGKERFQALSQLPFLGG